MPEETHESTETSTETTPTDKTFSQAEVTRIGTREKNEGRRAGVRDFLSELGVDDPEDLKSLIATHKAAQDKDKSDKERLSDENRKAKDAADKRDREAKRDSLNFKIERALLRAGMPLEKAERAVRLVDLDDVDADKDTIDAAVSEFKESFSEFFPKKEETEEEKTAREQKETEAAATGGLTPSKPPVPPRQRADGKSANDAAKDLLSQRHPKKKTNA